MTLVQAHASDGTATPTAGAARCLTPFADGGAAADGGDQLAPPRPQDRLAFPLAPADRHRLDLQATLTAAGIPPFPGDGNALQEIARLDGATVAAVVTWITAAAGR